MEYYSLKFLIWAVALGALSAVSLPLGSVIGLRTNLRPIYISTLAAFGAGALIAALTIELVAPTVNALQGGGEADHGGNVITNFYSLIIGLVMGGIVYYVLDQLVNAKGGFLRKKATTITYFRMVEKRRLKKILKDISKFSLLQNLEPEHIDTLVSMVRPVAYVDREVIGHQGEMIKDIIFIVNGKVSTHLDNKRIEEFEQGTVLGMVSMVAEIPNPGSAKAIGLVKGLALSRENFNKLRKISPAFDQECRVLASERIEFVEDHLISKHEQSRKWAEEATQALKVGNPLPQGYEINQAKKEHEGAPLAIWLGILIDGIPESFVIGSGLLVLLHGIKGELDTLEFRNIVPYTLIAGLFLSNFPEALSSSATMKLQGWGRRKIFFMWFTLMVITGIGAGLGFLLADSLNPSWLIFAEGLAAGAMLTMIASAMIPEAVHMGNANVVGLSTLAGFIAAISFKLLE
jgi:zinc transporter ZupT